MTSGPFEHEENAEKVMRQEDESERFIDDDDELEIEIVDDMPPEDREHAQDGEPSDDDLDAELQATQGMSEAELEQYLDENAPSGQTGFKKRLRKAHRNYHNERRRADQAERVQREAVAHLQRVNSELESMRRERAEGDVLLGEVSKGRIESEIELTQQQMRDAMEEGDTDLTVEMQSRLADLHVQRANAEMVSYRTPTEPTQNNQPQAAPAPQAPPAPDPRLAKWLQKNQWFNAPGRDDMTNFAYATHLRLHNQGVSVDADPEAYYGRIDNAMQTAFPDFFGETAPTRKTSRVAPANRSSGKRGPRRVQLTESQKQLCDSLSISYEDYAKSLLKEQRANG